MKVNRTSWHARIYLWWYAHKYPANGDNLPFTGRANLCPYMRTVLIYAPLRFLLTDWKTKWLPITLWPILLFGIPKLMGWISYDMKMFLWITEAVLAAAATLILVGCAIAWYSQRDKNIFQHIGEVWEKTKPERALVTAYIRSGHDRICPELTLED